MNQLVLGPVLRHVDEHSATVWVETERAGRVTIAAGDHQAIARTFAVHDHHYALVCLDGLDRGTKYEYAVDVDGGRVWPPVDSPYPPSLISTLDHTKPLRMAFGSCRTSVGHDAEGNETHGVDALRAYALRMAGITDSDHPDDPDPGTEVRWPDLVLFLGDQVYADETTEAMRTFIEARRDIEEEPGDELKDYQEYAELYRLAWTDPANRWLLSTLPSAMIFDDHDIRDDWNTSQSWKDEMEATSWWHERIVSGLASYWVYQHLGNLDPAERAADAIWQQIITHDPSTELRTGSEGEYDASALLDDLAARADRDPQSHRWSYAREYGDQARLIVLDSRAARVLDPEHRAMLDDGELAWLDEHLRGDTEHLLVGTSLPFLLAPGLHYVEAFGEALAGGAWGGRRAAKVGELIRQTGDLEHWAAFQADFQRIARMTLAVARGERGRPPRTVTFLGGDVHHSYVSEARPAPGEGGPPIRSRIIQAVCSPIRNPLSRVWRFATAGLAYGVAAPIGHVVAQSAKVPDAPIRWRLLKGPWFDNNLATWEVTPAGLRMWWATGVVDPSTELRTGPSTELRTGADANDTPRLVKVAEVTVQ